MLVCFCVVVACVALSRAAMFWVVCCSCLLLSCVFLYGLFELVFFVVECCIMRWYAHCVHVVEVIRAVVFWVVCCCFLLLDVALFVIEFF